MHRCIDYLMGVLRRQLRRLGLWIQGIILRQLTLLQTELHEHESTVTLFAVGIVFLLIGKFSGISYILAIGGLALAVSMLKALK